MTFPKDFVEASPQGKSLPQEPDYSIARRHVEQLSHLAMVANSGISVFDAHQQKHIFTSNNFTDLFGYDMLQVAEHNTLYFNRHIHPDDLLQLDRNGKAAMRYFESGEKHNELMQTKMINEYRLQVAERYIRVIEQYQVLELDPRGEVWLTLSVLDISPNQTPAETVQSSLVNYVTGEVCRLPEFSGNTADHPRLSQREKDILELVGQGLYSKEISEKLLISVHTVNTHRQRILEKLNVNNSLEAVRYATRHGLLN